MYTFVCSCFQLLQLEARNTLREMLRGRGRKTREQRMELGSSKLVFSTLAAEDMT